MKEILKNELLLLKNYFGLNKINDSKINTIRDELIIFGIKHEILECISNNKNILNEINGTSEYITKYKSIFINIENILNDKDPLKEKYNKLLDELNEKNKKLKELEKKLLDEFELNEKNKKLKELEKKLLDELNEKNKKLNELEKKLSRYPFQLSENEKLISVIFSSFEEDINYSLICKNTDYFESIENRFYEIFSEYNSLDYYFSSKGNKINKEKNLMENKIYDNDIILVERYNENRNNYEEKRENPKKSKKRKRKK